MCVCLAIFNEEQEESKPKGPYSWAYDIIGDLVKWLLASSLQVCGTRLTLALSTADGLPSHLAPVM